MKRPGQALIEFALILPICIALILGTFEIFSMCRAKLTMSDGLNGIAYFAMQHPNNDAAIQSFVTAVFPATPERTRNIVLDITRTCVKTQEFVLLELSYEYLPVFFDPPGDAIWKEVSRVPQIGEC